MNHRLSRYGSPSHALALIVRLCVTLAVVALALPIQLNGDWRAAAAAPLAAGHTYFVNSTADASDADQADGLCQTATGTCTLRAAVMQANFFVTGPNTITVPSGVYLLTRVGFDDLAIVGDLDISANLTIQGAGAGATIVDGNGAVTGDRVFQILATAQNVSLSDLTIRNGQAPTATYPSLGGGIYRDGNSNSGTPPSLHLTGVVIEGNTANWGGGLYAAGGQVELDSTSIRANTATYSGGGLRADRSRLTVRDSQVYSNTAVQGGGLLLADIDDGHIEHTEIYSNTADANGGGIVNAGTNANPFRRLTLVDSYLHHNHAAEGGGAIANYSSLVISRSVLDANTADVNGGGLMIYHPGSRSTMLINQSTLSHNWAQYGGGIYYNNFISPQSTLTLLNSTLSGNSASHDGGGLYADGAAQISLDNATIADNGLFYLKPPGYPVRGGGLFITGTATITAQNTIIADNFSRPETHEPPTADDCFVSPTTSLVSLDFNLVETTTNCIMSGAMGSNVTGLDPNLGLLQHNGGWTLTHALLPGSPAIDAGNPGGCTDDGGAPLTTDQRGVPRPTGPSPSCDIGAYEVASGVSQAIDFPPVPNKSLPSSPFVITATASSGLTVTFGTNTPAVCSVTASSLNLGVSSATVTLLHPGSCALMAQQPGDATFSPATPLPRTFDVIVKVFLPLVVR